MCGVRHVGQTAGGFVIKVSNGTSHSWPSRHLKRRTAISKLPPSILIAFPLTKASASFCLLELSRRWNVGREIFICSAHSSCSSPCRSLSRIASASSIERHTSCSMCAGTVGGLKYVTGGSETTRRHLTGLPTGFLSSSFRFVGICS
jgi:hypothetical protein